MRINNVSDREILNLITLYILTSEKLREIRKKLAELLEQKLKECEEKENV